MVEKEFKKIVWKYYQKNKRDLPWRPKVKTIDPYKVLLSELMLQQTQVDRVIPKYLQFLKKFPTVAHVVRAKDSAIIKLWSGLGYNRRALYLKRTLTLILKEHKGKIPKDPHLLEQFPGIGPYTAKAIATFAYNKPYVFIETNIRTVFIHHFFKNEKEVSDEKIVKCIENTLDKKQPRDWYYALMDYGSYLKKTVGNMSQKSLSYKKQPKFEGSNRKLRGMIIKKILENSSKPLSLKILYEHCNTFSKESTQKALKSLIKEGFLKESHRGFALR